MYYFSNDDSIDIQILPLVHGQFNTLLNKFHVFFSYSVLRQVQSEFSTKGDLVRLLSVSNILSFNWNHPTAAYDFFLVFSSHLSFLQ